MPLPFVYRWSDGRSLGALDSTLVEVETDTGLIDTADSCPWGNRYVPVFAGGLRVVLDEITPAFDESTMRNRGAVPLHHVAEPSS